MDDAVALGTAEQRRLPGRAFRFLKDEKLAAMAAAGSDGAFATLYQRHHQAIYRYCISLLRHEADARDALQSTMLAALTSLRAKPIEGEFKPWLFRIAHNQAISAIRNRAREAPSDAPPPFAARDDPETREQLRTLVSDLGALPDRQRGAIVMRELSGLSYTEIAAALGTSAAGGKQLVYEARSALQELRDGHEMSCDLVRERISAADRRLLRGRKVRSHLRGCQPCQDFEQAIRRRRTAFALLAPPLAPLAAAAVLQDVLGGGGAAGGAGGGGAAVGVTGMASGGAHLAAPAALKMMVATLLAGAAGVGAYEAGTAIFDDPVKSAPATVADGDGAAARLGAGDSRKSSGDAARAASNRGGDRGAGVAIAGKGNFGAAATGSGGGAPQTGDTAVPGVTGVPGGPADPGGSDGGSGGAVDSPASQSPSPAPDPPPSEDPAPSPPPPQAPDDGGSVPLGTPPGHGGTPPGHGGTPPGQVAGEIPPGHLGNPGQGGGRPRART